MFGVFTMVVIILLISGCIGIIAGRLLMGRWYNHLSIYTAIWMISLVLYSLYFIQYHPIIPEAWFFIAMAWLIMYWGSIMAIFLSAKAKYMIKHKISINTKSLKKVVIALSAIAILALILQWFILISEFGTIKAILHNANQLYYLRITGEIREKIPYISSFALAACSFAGAYTAVRNKLTMIGILPLVIIGLEQICIMARARLLIAIVLFITSYLYFPHLKLSKTKVFLHLLLASGIIIGFFIFISSVRGLNIKFSSGIATIEKLPGFSPSLYFYLSGPPVVFSEYLKVGKEEVYPGSNTFAPFFRLISHFGVIEKLPSYQKFHFVPEPMNTGTYLRELHADFGPIGILIFPYILGFIITILTIRIRYRPKLTILIILSHLYVIIVMSFAINATRLGYWAVSIVVATIISIALNAQIKRV